MVASVSNYIPYSYLYGAAMVQGRVSVPVPASQLPYANFKNVSGSAVEAASVYSLDKLKILDTLIDRLRSAKADKAKLPDSIERLASGGRDADEGRLDALTQEYGRELHAAIKSDALPYGKPGVVTPGMLVSFAA